MFRPCYRLGEVRWSTDTQIRGIERGEGIRGRGARCDTEYMKTNECCDYRDDGR